MRARVDDAVHVDAQIVALEARRVGPGAVERDADRAGLRNQVDPLLQHVADDLGTLLAQPSVEGRDSHF